MKIPFFNLEIKASKPFAGDTIGDTVRGLMHGYSSPNPKTDMFGFRLNVQSLFDVYATSGDVFGCVRELKQSIGGKGYRWVNKETREIMQDTGTKQLDKMLRAFGAFVRLKNKIIRDTEIAGNAYVEKVKSQNGQIMGFRCLDPRTMKVILSATGDVFGYVQTYGSKSVVFAPDEIAHFQSADEDISHEKFGMSPLETVLWDAKSDTKAAQTNFHFFENDARPATVYILDENMGEKSAKDALAFIRDTFSGPENKGKPAVMAGVKEIKTVSLSQEDMQYLQGRAFTTEKICAAYGVPKNMLGYTEGINHTNGEQLYVKFIENTARPKEQLLAEDINRLLIQPLGLTEAEFEFVPTETIDALTKWREVREDAKVGLITINEARKECGRKPAEDSDFADRHMVIGGANARFLEDVGVDPIMDPSNPDSQKAFLDTLSKAKTLLENE